MTLNEWILQCEQSKLEFIKKYDDGVSIIEDITSLSFIDIKQNIPDLMNDGKYDEVIALIKKERLSKVVKIPALDRYRMLIWIERQYEKLTLIEKKYLDRAADFKLLSAGIDKLNVLGIKNTIDLLANGDVTKWKDIEQLPYSICFEKQLKLAIENDINKKLVELNRNERKK